MQQRPSKPDLSETSPFDPAQNQGSKVGGNGSPVIRPVPDADAPGTSHARTGPSSGASHPGSSRPIPTVKEDDAPTPPRAASSGGGTKLPGGSRVASGGADGPGDAKERTKSAMVDTFIGRLVVDQGLSTPEEVQQCLEQQRGGIEESNALSLAELLVENNYITRRQAERLKAQAEAERSGQQIPGYKIIEKLGAGAMATVFKAKQLSLDRMVAIKVLPKKFSSSKQFVERFYAEGRSAAQLNHPNIVQAYDVNQAGEHHYIVMEYVDGRTVYDDIVKHKRLPESEAINITMQIADALQHAHERGLIHRDVKPKNLMLTKEGVAKLADMGLARAVTDREAAEEEKGKAFGTPYYISPEQIRGELRIGPQADIYSLGATLYHMVVGTVPFDGKNPTDVMQKHLKAELVPPDHANPNLSPGISEVIEMMMAKDPKKRYVSCKDLLVDLKAVRHKQTPPIAHKDFAAMDLASLAKAEAVAPAVMSEDKSHVSTGGGISTPLFVVMCALLVVSVIVNVVLVAR